MLQKLKDFGDAVKGLLLFILLPLFVLALLFYHLLVKNHELEDEVKAKDGEEKLKELSGEAKQIDSSANDATSEYAKLRDDYLQSGDKGVRPGPSSEGQSDKG